MERMSFEPSSLTYAIIPSKVVSSSATGAKNRTGVAIAFILAAAGVDYATIEREYTLTKEGFGAYQGVACSLSVCEVGFGVDE